jgi:hypothetical protein
MQRPQMLPLLDCAPDVDKTLSLGGGGMKTLI